MGGYCRRHLMKYTPGILCVQPRKSQEVNHFAALSRLLLVIGDNINRRGRKKMDHENVIMRVERQITSLVRARVPTPDILDVVQDAFLSCVEAGYFSESSWRVPCAAFVETITRRRIADYCRKRTRAPALPTDFNPVAPETLDTPENRDERRHIRRIVARLDKRYRQVVEARYFHDWPDRKIASWLGKPLETIRTRRKRAMRAIRSELESAS